MSEKKSQPRFTPGPWVSVRADRDSGDFDYTIVADGRGIDVAATFESAAGPVARANSHLIAAAPDLFAACELAFRHLDGSLQGGKSDAHGGETERIASECWAALSKARGETR